MKTLTLGAITLLLAASALNTAVESRSHETLAHAKFSHQKQLQGRLGIGREENEELTECLKTWGYDLHDDILGFLMNGYDPEKDQCLWVCVAENLGIMVDGKFSKENFIDNVNDVLKVERETVIVMGDDCEKFIAGEAIEDKCDLADAIMNCYHTSMFHTFS